MKKLLIVFTTLIFLFSCTDNENARNYGGTQKIDLDPGERLQNITWKNDDLWILTKQDTTKPSVYTFGEKASYGVWNGKVIINEK